MRLPSLAQLAADFGTEVTFHIGEYVAARTAIGDGPSGAAAGLASLGAMVVVWERWLSPRAARSLPIGNSTGAVLLIGACLAVALAMLGRGWLAVGVLVATLVFAGASRWGLWGDVMGDANEDGADAREPQRS